MGGRMGGRARAEQTWTPARGPSGQPAARPAAALARPRDGAPGTAAALATALHGAPAALPAAAPALVQLQKSLGDRTAGSPLTGALPAPSAGLAPQRSLAGAVQSTTAADQHAAPPAAIPAATTDAAPRPNRTGLPDRLKAGVEHLSGFSLDDVQVHYNSPAPARLGALAYAQGTDIHLGPGQERHLPHEAWHVAQQMQGRVRTTVQMRGMGINDDTALEREADRMGAAAWRLGHTVAASPPPLSRPPAPDRGGAAPIQGLGLLENYDPDPRNRDALPALRDLLEDTDPDKATIHHILETFEKLSEGWKSGLSDVLTAILRKHGAEAGIPETIVTYGPVTRYAVGKRRATSMTASLLTSNPGTNRGSDDTGSSWPPYVEGHLLNHLLHGPAETKNLAPFTGALNGAHKANVEDPLKKMIYNQGRYFSYRVTVHPTAATTKVDFYPTHIVCNVRELDTAPPHRPKTGGYALEAQLTQDGDVDVISSANLSTAPGPDTPLKFKTTASDSKPDLLELESEWNALFRPWSAEYGEIVKTILEAAYDAVQSYEESSGPIRPPEVGGVKLFLPKTEVTFGATKKVKTDFGTYNIATRMTANPLTMRPGNTAGRQPDSDTAWSPYLKGHLLNHHVHGPATDQNLTPMTNSLNTQFEKNVENNVKQWVMEGGKVLSYTVTMYGTPELNDTEPFEPEDGFFPARLSCKVDELRPRTGKTGKDLEKKQNWTLSRTRLTKTYYNTKSATISPENE